MTPTDEQQAILERAPAETMKVLAGAGCGKTSTLEAYGRRWPGRGLYLAFNNSIAKEAARRLPENVEARTAHSFAYRGLDVQRFNDRLEKRLTLEHLDRFPGAVRGVAGVPLKRVGPAILRTIEAFLACEGDKMVRAHCDIEDAKQNRAIREMAGAITLKLLRFADNDLPFSHDVYLKRFEMKHRIKGYDYLLLDEAQDLNPVLISIARKAKMPIVVVGDPYQSIYRFRGAVDAMGQFDGREFPLTQSWRFGAEIATLSNRILAHSSTPPRHRMRGSPSIETEITRYSGKVGSQPGTAILARTNARLFESLASIDRPFHLVGGLKDLRSQLRSAEALRSGRHRYVSDPSIARFATWKALEAAAEQGDSEMRRMRGIIDKHGDRLSPLLERLTQLHRDDEAAAQIVVSTTHKAKGREWDTVVVLDDFEAPAELAARQRGDATKADDADQQINLLYVACTRARNHLLLAPKLYDALC